MPIWSLQLKNFPLLCSVYFSVEAPSYKIEQSQKTLCVSGVNRGWNLSLRHKGGHFTGRVFYFTVIDILYKIVQQN